MRVLFIRSRGFIYRRNTPFKCYTSFAPPPRAICTLRCLNRVPIYGSSSRPFWRGQKRGKKTKSTLIIEELPQGVIPIDSLPIEQDDRSEPVYPTVVQQARNHMQKFENCVLLTRVGGFYELYFEHAEKYGPLLNLKVGRKEPKNAPAYSMSGFPFFQLDRYLKILVQDLQRYVAIAEEFRNDPSDKVKAGGLMNDRKVSRIVTPGTLIDENFMDPFTNNYVLAIHVAETARDISTQRVDLSTPSSQLDSQTVGLAWLDLSTGQFYTQSTSLPALPSFISRISPREIVLEESLQVLKSHNIYSLIAEDQHLITFVDSPEVKPLALWKPMLESPIPPKLVAEFTHEETAAGSSLLRYVEERLQGSEVKLQPPSRQHDMMEIDRNTLRALEIKKTIREDVLTGSLLHTIRRTATKGGARLLDTWLSSPSTSIIVINSRLDLVAYMLEQEELRERITILLKRSHDSHRLLQKFAFGRGDPDDLLALSSTIQATEEIVSAVERHALESESVQSMVTRIKLDGPKTLSIRIRDSIDEEGIVQQHQFEQDEAIEVQVLAQSIVSTEGNQEDSSILPKGKRRRPTSIRDHYSDDKDAWTMKPAASPALVNLHQELKALAMEKITLADDLCKELGATTLTLRFTPGLGHICHVKGKDIKLDHSSIRNVSSSKSTRSFHHPLWTSLGSRIIQCKSHIQCEEQRVFSSLRSLLIHNIVNLRRNASVLDELDVACSFATLAAEKRWTRPVLTTSTTHKIVSGRHPTVEGGLHEDGRTFVTNDCFVGSPKTTWLITGPNMAGKSTFLRQNAIITILAQIGSYVPASYAEIGIVDQIFSRVGSADNLYKDQSTFMVEMLETAAILKLATKRSFVIMDEIGRGTTPDDGTAVAFACLWHLEKVNKCRTLFATHFHGLVDMAQAEGLDGVGFWCTDVEEDDMDGETGSFRYVHRLREGVNRQSHALKVAKLAGLPRKAIDMAERVLSGARGQKPN